MQKAKENVCLKKDSNEFSYDAINVQGYALHDCSQVSGCIIQNRNCILSIAVIYSLQNELK